MRSYYMYQRQMVDVHITVYRFCRSCHIWIVAFSALILIMIPRSYGQLVRHGKWYSDTYGRIMRPFICMTDDTKSLHRHYRHLTKWTHVYGTVRKIESLISDIFDKNIDTDILLPASSSQCHKYDHAMCFCQSYKQPQTKILQFYDVYKPRKNDKNVTSQWRETRLQVKCFMPNKLFAAI